MNANVLNKFLIVSLIFLSLQLYFFSEMTSYFSQDDFFHLSTIMGKNIGDVLALFSQLSHDYAFYRPISRELYNLVALKMFGLSPLPYHFINLALIVINGYLAIKFFISLDSKLESLDFKSIFFFLYFLSAVHSVELYYLSSVQTLLATSFTLLGLLLFVKRKFYSLIFFILAMMSHESSIVFIPIAFLLKFTAAKENIRVRFIRSITSLVPFLLVLVIRVLLHYFGFGLDASTTYNPDFSLQSIINTALWYVLWTLGMPELLVDFATFRLQFNPNLFKYYGEFTSIAFPSFLVLIFILIFMLFKIKKNLASRLFVFLSISYALSIIPLVFFPSHKFVYYLSFPVIIFAGLLSYIAFNFLRQNSKLRTLIIVFLFAYFLISLQTLKINYVTYWAAKRARSAEYIVNDVKKRYSNLERGSSIYIIDDPNYPFIAKEWGTSSKQAYYILSGSDAFRLIFNDPSIKTFYQAINPPPKNQKLIIYEAKFPY